MIGRESYMHFLNKTFPNNEFELRRSEEGYKELYVNGKSTGIVKSDFFLNRMNSERKYPTTMITVLKLVNVI